MAKKAAKVDPDDGFSVGEVGPWAVDKHERLRKYIQASHGARQRYLPPTNDGGASYIELYSGAGRSVIKDTNQFIEGSAVVAFNAGRASGRAVFRDASVRSSRLQNSARRSAQRIKTLWRSADKL